MGDNILELWKKPKKWEEMIWGGAGSVPVSHEASKGFEFDFGTGVEGAGSYLSDPKTVAKSYASDGGWDFGKMFSGENMGATLGGIGTAISGAAAIYNAYQTKQYQDKLFKMEKERVDRANERQKKAQADYEKSTGW